MHGRYRTLLKAGETITTRAGLTVHPEEVRMLKSAPGHHLQPGPMSCSRQAWAGGAVAKLTGGAHVASKCIF